MKLIAQVLVLLSLLSVAIAYFITIDAHSEECFHEKVQMNAKLELTFEVAEGGFLDIDVTITGPDGKTIYTISRESNGKYTFAAATEGSYRYCFGNKMSTMTPKIVMFSMDVVKPGEDKPAGKDGEKDDEASHQKLQQMVEQLSHGLTSVKHEQEYMEVRERIHRQINENTNSRVVLWAFFEAAVLVTMTVGQIYYLKRFFEVRRVV